MNEVILYAIIALGLSGLTFFMYVKNLSKSSQPKKVINNEDEELKRILKIQELELQNQQKKENSFEIRKLENPLQKKEKFKASYSRAFPNREIKNESQISSEKPIEEGQNIAPQNVIKNSIPQQERSTEKEKTQKELEEKERVEKLRIESEKRARAEAVRQKTLQNFLYFQQKRDEIKERNKSEKEKVSI